MPTVRRAAVVGLLVAALLVVGGVAGFAASQMWSADGSGNDRDSMMGSDGMSSGMMGQPAKQEPFDLQFIDQMVQHHEGALMSSEHMISDCQRPELRKLYKNIQKSQSEQIEQMQERRKEWYPDAEQMSDMPTGMMSDGMMQGMMGGSMQQMMGGDATDAMFLKMMIPHHQMAVDMSEQALERAEHPELQELAQTIIDEQSAEITLMQGYLDEIERTTNS